MSSAVSESARDRLQTLRCISASARDVIKIPGYGQPNKRPWRARTDGDVISSADYGEELRKLSACVRTTHCGPSLAHCGSCCERCSTCDYSISLHRAVDASRALRCRWEEGLHAMIVDWMKAWDEICRFTGLDESAEILETTSMSRHGVTAFHMLLNGRDGVREGWAWTHVLVADAVRNATRADSEKRVVNPKSLISADAQYEINLRELLDSIRVWSEQLCARFPSCDASKQAVHATPSCDAAQG